MSHLRHCLYLQRCLVKKGEPQLSLTGHSHLNLKFRASREIAVTNYILWLSF